jgi:hypothetical protein
MKHPSSREFFAYWDDKRGVAAAPDRSEIEPGAVRELLGDIFVLSCDAAAGYPFRVAGTRVCALLGCDLKGHEFTALFAPGSRREIADLLGIVVEETQAIVAGLTASSADGATTHLELLLLPFNSRAHTPISLTGLLAPLSGGSGVMSEVCLTSWRTIGQRPRFAPRALRKWSVVRGLMVYEGLR